jgi:hypothetical protein
VLQDMQNRAYSVGQYKVGDDIQAHVSALGIVKTCGNCRRPIRSALLATGNLDARLAQRESGGKPDV